MPQSEHRLLLSARRHVPLVRVEVPFPGQHSLAGGYWFPATAWAPQHGSAQLLFK